MQPGVKEMQAEGLPTTAHTAGIEVVVKSLHPLVKSMFIMSVFSSNDLYTSHVSVMSEWNTNDFVTKSILEVWFNNEFIIGLLKM